VLYEKILICDDEPDVLALCVRIIRSAGYDVTGAHHGAEAIELARTRRYDLFLTDLMMPGIKGLEAAQIIRESQPDIVCVMMTGFGTMDTAIQALKLGFTEFVVKPFKPQDLKVAVNRALEKERLRTEVQRLKALVPLFELNKTLMSTVEEEVLVEKVLRTACEELNADVGLLALRGEDQNLHIRASREHVSLVNEDATNLVADTAQALLEAREQVLEQASAQGSGQVQAMIEALDVQSLLFNPLLAMDAPVGALILAKREGSAPFAPGDRELLSVLCGQAAVALQNARLFKEIQRAYKDLQELDHMKGEFVNIAAHELRTPLAILMGHADLLAEDTRDLEIKRRLQIIVRNGLRLRDLIQALLDMKHLQTGEMPVSVMDFGIDELVDSALQDFYPMAEKKEIEILAAIPDGLTSIHADWNKVWATLSNLIQNAIQFTPRGGRVGVEVRDRHSELWVTVWDTGVGIAEDEFERIFQPFYQVEDSLTREHEGIGLGLSIAKGMIELCGGRIWVESDVGRGSRFTFAVPKQNL
jgi:signal transduction histidine kinase/CheY-like chemotaxis protein